MLPAGTSGLDLATRGGPRPGGVLVVGSAPGAGKTTWLVQLALEWAQAGVYVTVLAADEAADGLLIRIGQQPGFEREVLERDDRSELARFSDRLRALSQLALVDADEEGAGVEAALDELRHRASNRPALLLVDSLQTVRAAGTMEADGPGPAWML